MTELLTGISAQPDFPFDDLNEDNAALLEFMLANKGLLDQCHTTVEQVSWLFRIGHVSLMHGTAKVYDEATRLSAVDHGVKTFEAITGFVNGVANSSDISPVNNRAATIRNMGVGEIGDYFDGALHGFSETLPRTTEVVRLASSRFYEHLTSYAVLGAALAYQFELDVSAA